MRFNTFFFFFAFVQHFKGVYTVHCTACKIYHTNLQFVAQFLYALSLYLREKKEKSERERERKEKEATVAFKGRLRCCWWCVAYISFLVRVHDDQCVLGTHHHVAMVTIHHGEIEREKVLFYALYIYILIRSTHHALSRFAFIIAIV